MHKQCNQCGDYFFTTISTRLFCNHQCARIYIQDRPTMTKHSPKLTRLDGSDSKKCALCPTLIPLLLLVKVKWEKKIHLVCKECAIALGEKVEEDMFLVKEDILPSSFELE